MEKNISLIILSLIFIVACSPQTNPVIKKNITNVADVVVEQANITNTTIIEIPSYTISPIPSLIQEILQYILSMLVRETVFLS